MGDLHKRIRRWTETAPDPVLNLVLVGGIVFLVFALLSGDKLVKILGVLVLLV
jgi:hypothetical protein